MVREEGVGTRLGPALARGRSAGPRTEVEPLGGAGLREEADDVPEEALVGVDGAEGCAEVPEGTRVGLAVDGRVVAVAVERHLADGHAVGVGDDLAHGEAAVALGERVEPLLQGGDGGGAGTEVGEAGDQLGGDGVGDGRGGGRIGRVGQGHVYLRV